MALSDSLQKVRQLPEGKRRFLMLLSMITLSFLVLAIAWKSFEQNLGIRLGNAPQENGDVAPGPFESLVEDVKRVAKGEEPLTQESGITNQEPRGTLDWIFSVARETRRVVKYNAGEMWIWGNEVFTNYFR